MTTTAEATSTPQVMFACVRNGGRSVISRVLTEHYAGGRATAHLDSNATAGEGTQNLMCAAQAGAVLIGLATTAAWPGGSWVDPVIALGIAAWSIWEGVEACRGEDCC
jgi:divalent metal cation (Fe/Co/Zn/Cd) transporter